MKKLFFSVLLGLVILIFFSALAFTCTSMLIGKDATTDGSVIFAGNDDWTAHRGRLIYVPRMEHGPGETFKLFRGNEIPQVPVTYAYMYGGQDRNVTERYLAGALGREVRKPVREDAWILGINEYQVAVGGNSAGTRPIPESGIVEPVDIRVLILERAKTAREGIEIAGELIEKYEQAFCAFGDNYTVMAIADPNEGWWLELYGGKNWVAMRVPDNMASVRPNCFGTHKIDFDDKANFMYSENLVNYAVEKGWYDPASDEPFDPAKIYAADTSIEWCKELDPSNNLRRWRMVSLLVGEDLPEDEIIYEVVPEHKLTVKDAMSIMTDLLEGTKYDLAKQPGAGAYGNPFYAEEGKPRSVGNFGTCYSTIAQLRSWLPNEIGGVWWVSLDNGYTSVYIPWYVGITEIPDVFSYAEEAKYSEESAFWVFNELSNLTLRRFSDAIEDVRPVWQAFQDENFALQETIEKTALELYKKDKSLARSFLTTYSNCLGMKAFDMAKDMANKLRGKYQDQEMITTLTD